MATLRERIDRAHAFVVAAELVTSRGLLAPGDRASAWASAFLGRDHHARGAERGERVR
jgi:hypothetical protein